MSDATNAGQRKRRHTERARSVATRRSQKDEHILAARFDKDTYRQFKMVAAANLMGTDELLAYGISLAFDKLGQPIPSGIVQKLKALDLVD